MSKIEIMKSFFLLVIAFILLTNSVNAQVSTYTHLSKASSQNKSLLFALKMSGVKKDKKKPAGNSVVTRKKPIKKLYRKHIVSSEKIGEHFVYSIAPKKEGRGLTVLYLHGGAYTADFLKQHWQFMSKLVLKTGATVIAPDYPLSPEFSWKDNISFVLKVYNKLLATVPADSIVFMGDSAGGGLILALAMAARDAGLPQPKHIVMLAPWLDLEMKNPEIEKLEKRDPMLNLASVKRSAMLYAGDSSALREPYVSPMFGDLKNIAAMSLFIGGRDVLQADAELFKNRCQLESKVLNYYFYPEMIHVWMLVPFLPESELAFIQIKKVLD